MYHIAILELNDTVGICYCRGKYIYCYHITYICQHLAVNINLFNHVIHNFKGWQQIV